MNLINLKTLHILSAFSIAYLLSGCVGAAVSKQVSAPKYLQDNKNFYDYSAFYKDGSNSNLELRSDFTNSIDKYINTKAGGDCSGFILVLNKEYNSIFFDNNAVNHFFTNGRGRSQAIFNYYSSQNKIAFDNPRVGDLIFFQNTTRATRKVKNGNITHIGVVSEIYKDGRVRFVHNTKGKNRNGYMNLQKKNIFISDKKTQNSYIISCSSNKTSCLTSNRFAGYGKVQKNKIREDKVSIKEEYDKAASNLPR